MLSRQRVLCGVCAPRVAGVSSRQTYVQRCQNSSYSRRLSPWERAWRGALTGKTAPVDTLKSARIRAKARLREALAQDDKVSNPDVIAAVDALSIYNPTDAPAYDLDARPTLP